VVEIFEKQNKIKYTSKKGTKKLTLAAELVDAHKQANISLAELSLLTDPIKRLLKVERIIKDIDTRITKKQNEININIYKKKFMMHLGSLVVFLAGFSLATPTLGVKMGMLTLGLLPLGLMTIGTVGWIYGTEKIVNSAKKRLESKNQPLMSMLEIQKIYMSTLTSMTIESNLMHEGVFDKFPDKFPDVRKQFTEVRIEKIIKDKPTANEVIPSQTFTEPKPKL